MNAASSANNETKPRRPSTSAVRSNRSTSRNTCSSLRSSCVHEAGKPASRSVARNILTDRLRKLVDADILQLHAASDGTTYQEYVLTPRGESLFPILVALRQWGEQHLYQRGERHSQLLDNRTGKPVPLMRLQGSDGSVLAAADTRVRKLK